MLVEWTKLTWFFSFFLPFRFSIPGHSPITTTFPCFFFSVWIFFLSLSAWCYFDWSLHQTFYPILDNFFFFLSLKRELLYLSHVLWHNLLLYCNFCRLPLECGRHCRISAHYILSFPPPPLHSFHLYTFLSFSSQRSPCFFLFVSFRGCCFRSIPCTSAKRLSERHSAL